MARVIEPPPAHARYTDNVDTSRYWGREATIEEQLREAFNTLVGLLVTHGLAPHREAALRPHADNAPLLRALFEVGRRYKVVAPRRLRAGERGRPGF